jgi:hypothetical protein
MRKLRPQGFDGRCRLRYQGWSLVDQARVNLYHIRPSLDLGYSVFPT